MSLAPSDKTFYFSVCFPTTPPPFIYSLKSGYTQTHQWRSSEAGWLTCNRQKQKSPLWASNTWHCYLSTHRCSDIHVLRFRDAVSSPFHRKSGGNDSPTLLSVYSTICQRNRRTKNSSMSFAKCLTFQWKPLFWCHSICTAQPFSLLNSVLNFMLNFTNTIPGIILSIINPLTYSMFTLSLCPVYGWGNWDMERLWNLPKVTQFVNSVLVPLCLYFGLEGIS